MENNRDKFLWRENDTSSKTSLRYSMEISHWLSAIKSSTPNTTSFAEAYGFIGLLLSFTFNILFFVILILIEAVQWIIKVWPKKKDKYDGVPTFANRKPLSNEEANELIRRANESGVIEEMDLS